MYLDVTLQNKNKNLVASDNNSPVCYAKGDSAASYYYIREEDSNVCTNIFNEKGPPVGLPNSTKIKGHEAGYIPLSDKLTPKAKRARILPSLKSSSLISLSQLADDGCISILNVLNRIVCNLQRQRRRWKPDQL